MSVKVDLDQLADALADFTFAYLITVGDDYRAHTVAVEPVYTEGVLDVGPAGGHTRRNLAEHGDVTLVWPPREPDGYTLIVDGHGRSGRRFRARRAQPRRAAPQGGAGLARGGHRLRARLRATRTGLRADGDTKGPGSQANRAPRSSRT